VSATETPTGLLLSETNLEIRHADKSQVFPCKVYFDLRINNSILIEPLESVDPIYEGFNEGSFWLSIPNVREPVQCYLAASNVRMGSRPLSVSVKLAPRLSLIEVDHASPLVRVNAGVLNLGHYWIGRPGPSIFSLSYNDWIVDFSPVTDETLQYYPSVQDGKYFFTHHICMRKSGDRSFSCSEAHTKLHELCTFLSFCHGHWVSTALTYGFDEQGNVAMEEWGTRQVSRWSEGSNWLDRHHGKCILELFSKFMKLMAASADWKAAIQHVVYWYVRADTNLIGPDGACVLLQAALERLAWHVLVRERQLLSEKRFSNLPAADQLRLLLTTLSIPLALPPGLVELRQSAKGRNWPDGPQAFVEIRNRIVHPPKRTQQAKGLPYYDAYRLAKWYLELAVLSACGYMGVYSNRTREHGWVGEVEPVPWAS
jgi:hypothetical protein